VYDVKRVLSSIAQERREYFLYLVRESLSSLSRAEDYYSMHMYPSADRMLFHSAELFWKSLIVLSDQVFDFEHEPPLKEFAKISEDVLSSAKKAELYKITSELSEARRNLAIYGYVERGRKVSIAPSRLISSRDVDQDLERVRTLAEALRRVHLFQVSSNPIKVGVLSGYVSNPVREVRCQSYMYSQFGTVSRWTEDLKKSYGEELFSELFAPVEINVADLGSGFYPIAINPFGECFPEKGVGKGVALQTILEYIRDGGIFVNTAGHPFIYTWNVSAASDNQRMLVSSFSTITGVQIKRNQEGELQIVPVGTTSFPGDALALTTEIKAQCAWDRPDAGVVGPQELDLRFGTTIHRIDEKANVFRPILPDSLDRTIPLAIAENKSWGRVYPIAAIPYGRGFLVSCGLSLNEKREYRILLETIEAVARNGLDMLLPGGKVS
jgi:hypothetical protein